MVKSLHLSCIIPSVLSVIHFILICLPIPICFFLFFVLLIHFPVLLLNISFLPHFPPSSTHPYFFINVSLFFPSQFAYDVFFRLCLHIVPICFPDFLLNSLCLSLFISCFLYPFLLLFFNLVSSVFPTVVTHIHYFFLLFIPFLPPLSCFIFSLVSLLVQVTWTYRNPDVHPTVQLRRSFLHV